MKSDIEAEMRFAARIMARTRDFGVGIGLALAGLFLPTWALADAPAHLVQVPPSAITASGSSQYTASYTPQHANDGSIATYWRTDGALPQWIQFDLGQSRWVGALRVYCNNATYGINGYAIYLANEANPADWGTPVKTGNLSNSMGWQDISFNLTAGRYLRLVATSRYASRIYFAEMEVYAEEFVLADPLTGSKEFTGSNVVDVAALPGHDGYTHYQITTNQVPPDSAPESWTSTSVPPQTLTYSRPAVDQEIIRTAWYTNLTSQVPLLSDWTKIIYTTELPIPMVHATLTRQIAPGYTVAKIYATDLDTGSSGGTALSLPIGIANFKLACAQDTTPNDPTQVTLDSVGVYEVLLTVMNAAGHNASATTQVSVVSGSTLTWLGAGANALASTPANWVGGIAPQSGDSVLFDDEHFGNPRTNVTWDLDVVLLSWTQTTNYAGTVTLQTRYPGQGTFTNLVVANDVTLAGGAWTHPANTGVTIERERLAVKVDGDFTLGNGGKIDLFGRGYAESRGPGAGVSGQRTGKGASHGGVGAIHSTELPSPTYGSVTRPAALGSGSSARGGGALWLEVGGNATIDGEITVKGAYYLASNRYGGGAGGSIYLEAATIGGSGLLNACGGEGYYTGGGGRIALVARAGADTGQLQFEPYGGSPVTSGGRGGSPGTVYRQTTSFKQLVVDAGNLATQASIATELPPALELENYDIHPIVGGELENTTLILTNSAHVMLTSGLRMGDFAWIGANTSLDLYGRFLYLKAVDPQNRDPLMGFPNDFGNGTLTYDGGAIFWDDASATVPLFLSSGPNGSATRDPESLDDLYAFDSWVTLSATPDAGYDFIWWAGDVPASADRTSNPLQVKMDQTRTLRAQFSSNAAKTRTWTGDATVRWASNATNWYPAIAPAAGDHIIFDATSRMECFWDLDIAPASWTQMAGYTASYDFFEGYRGWVTLHTRYPGQGSFTNLHITGNCTLEAGTWTHPANTGVDAATDRMWVSVGGDFRLATNALIDVSGRGYAVQRGPGAGITAQRLIGSGYAASHGGRGTYGTNTLLTAAACYGSIPAPESLGSGGGYGSGGGAVRLEVVGHSRIDGIIDARGTTGSTQHPGSSGGSILLTAATLAGDGALEVTGTSGYQSGGGGRIAVILTDSDTTGNVKLHAQGGEAAALRSDRGAAGTIYLKTSNTGGTLLIDNNNYATTSTNWFTELPPTIGADAAALRDMTLDMRNQARVGILAPNLHIRDLTVGPTATLHLKGHDLYVHSFEPRNGLDGTVVEDGGRIIWSRRGTVFLVR